MHAGNPVTIYHQCIGCELEWYQKRVKELEEENSILKRPEAIESTESPSVSGSRISPKYPKEEEI